MDIRSGQVRSGQVRSGQVRTGQVRTDSLFLKNITQPGTPREECKFGKTDRFGAR